MMEAFPNYLTILKAGKLKDLMDRSEFHKFMDFANEVLRGCGVETIRDKNEWVVALYVNMGDTYDTTFLYDIEKGRIYITSWGDWYEEWSQGEQSRQEKFKKGDRVSGLKKKPKKPRKLKYADFWNVKGGY